MDNKNLPLREEDETLVNIICETMTQDGREKLLIKYGVIEYIDLKGKSETYHFQFYKSNLFNKVQQKNLNLLLISRGIKEGIRFIEKLPTSTTTKLETARDVFECFAEIKGISKPECLLEFLELCNKNNFPLVAYENDHPGLEDTIEDLKKYISDSKSRADLGQPVIDDIQNNSNETKVVSNNIKPVTGEEKWLDPYNFDELPLVGREKEFDRLDEFIKSDGQFKIWAIVGPSGAGKTRLASQWAYESSELKDWDRRFLHKEDRTEPEKWSNWIPDKSTLLIIDYMYGFDEVVLKLMNHRVRSDVPEIRLLLIDHVLSEPLHSDKRWGFSGDRSSLNRNEKFFFDTKPLDLRQTQNQEVIIKSIIARRAEIDRESDQVDIAHKYLKETQGAYHPLFAALVGEAIIKSGNDFKVWNRRELIDYYLSGNDRLPWEHRKDSGRWASHFIAVATARGGMNYRDLIKAAVDCTSAPERFDEVKSICQNVISDNDAITLAPFRPDILGESFFLKFLQFFENSPKYQEELQQMLRAGNEDTQEFIFFIQRLTQNLLNDDQSLKETQALWDSLFHFVNPMDLGKTKSVQWWLTVGLIDIVDAIKDHLPKDKIIRFLDKIESTILYDEDKGSFFLEYVLYPMRYFELMHSFTETSPEHSTEMLMLFYQYASNEFNGESLLMLASWYGFKSMIAALIQHGVDKDTIFEGGDNALIIACKRGHTEAVKCLLHAKINIHATDQEVLTALMWASAKGYIEIVNLLLNEKPVINAVDNKNRTALILASMHGQTEIVKLLIDKEAEIDLTDAEKRTALICASINDHAKTVELLLAMEADVNAQDNKNRTALIWASAKGYTEIVKLLLTKAQNLHVLDTENFTALQLACIEGHNEIIKLLLEKEVNTETFNADVITGFHLASMYGQADTIRFLLAHRADIIDSIDNHQGLTALMLASGEGHIETVKLLLDKGAKIDISDNKGLTALHLASINGYFKTVRLLIDEMENIDIAGKINGLTALMLASGKGHIKTVKLLLNREAKIDATDKNYRTALMWACLQNRISIVELLLRREAKTNIVNKEQQTALAIARVKGYTDIVQLLIDYGAQDKYYYDSQPDIEPPSLKTSYNEGT